MTPPKKKAWPWILVVILVLGSAAITTLILVAAAVSGSTGDRVALIELSGPITDEGTRGLLGVGGSSGGARGFIQDVARAEADKEVKAVVIRVNSPGGSASASQEMYQAVRRLRAAKPVVCSMGDVAASGGYYVASACDKIYANGSTLTGSIGVISEFLNYASLFQKLGLDQTVIKSGKFKDAGNPARPLTAEERQLFQAMIMDVYQQFTADVVDGRKAATGGKLTMAKLLVIANGSVYTGRQAKANLLVDANGGLYEAVNEAGKLGHIEGKPKIKNMSRGGGLFSMLSASDESSLSGIGTDLGAAFARGAVSQLKSESQGSVAPQLR